MSSAGRCEQRPVCGTSRQRFNRAMVAPRIVRFTAVSTFQPGTFMSTRFRAHRIQQMLLRCERRGSTMGLDAPRGIRSGVEITTSWNGRASSVRARRGPDRTTCSETANTFPLDHASGPSRNACAGHRYRPDQLPERDALEGNPRTHGDTRSLRRKRIPRWE